jgi:23S rRNA pseudouridine1911/1915/1917 synthase
VGDPTYGGVRRHVPNDVRAVQRLERPFLHAWRLVFTHPTDGRRLEFESPLPADLQAVLDAIREKQSDEEV